MSYTGQEILIVKKEKQGKCFNNGCSIPEEVEVEHISVDHEGIPIYFLKILINISQDDQMPIGSIFSLSALNIDEFYSHKAVGMELQETMAKMVVNSRFEDMI